MLVGNKKHLVKVVVKRPLGKGLVMREAKPQGAGKVGDKRRGSGERGSI